MKIVVEVAYKFDRRTGAKIADYSTHRWECPDLLRWYNDHPLSDAESPHDSVVLGGLCGGPVL
jgi:hypothetical protein